MARRRDSFEPWIEPEDPAEDVHVSGPRRGRSPIAQAAGSCDAPPGRDALPCGSATFSSTVLRAEEVVPVNAVTWVLPSGVAVGR